MATINLAGRIPLPKPTISGRLLALAVAVFLLLVAGIAYGFHYRFAKQEQRKQAQHVATVASDAAQSNRASVEGESTLLPVTTPATGAGIATPLLNAANTVAHPFPAQTSSQAAPAAAPPAAYYGTPPALETPDPQEQLRTQELARRYARQQAAVEGPTGNQHATAQPDLASLNPQAPLIPSAQYSVPTPAAAGEQLGYVAQNEQAQKRRFEAGGEGQGDDYLKTSRVPPLSPWVLQRGESIPASLPQSLVSDLPGDLIADVQRDVYDSPTHKYVMIPAGSRLVGEYNSSVTYGQNRVQVVWTAVYFPDGSFIDLDRMPSHSADGSAGLKDQVDNHWKRIIGGAALSSLFAAGLQISQNRSNGSVLTYPSTGQVASGAVGTQAAELGQQITSRNLNIQPTLKIRPGEIFAVSVKKDILFPGPYEALPAR